MNEQVIQPTDSADADRWSDMLHRIFPDHIPAAFKWSAAPDITYILNRIVDSGASRVYAPDGHRFTLSAAGPAAETGCLAIEEGETVHILRPARLAFEVVNDMDLRWAWFRLETSELEATGKDPQNADCGFEMLLETDAGQYQSRAGPVPAGARPVIRHLGGMFVFLAKASPYQLGDERGTGEAENQHSGMNKTAFRKALSKMADILFKTANP